MVQYQNFISQHSDYAAVVFELIMIFAINGSLYWAYTSNCYL